MCVTGEDRKLSLDYLFSLVLRTDTIQQVPHIAIDIAKLIITAAVHVFFTLE